MHALPGLDAVEILIRKLSQESPDRPDSEEKQQVLDRRDRSYCIVEVQFDELNKPVDYTFLQTGEFFESQTGLSNPIGRGMRELSPQLEQYWYDLCGRVALTGEELHFIAEAAALVRWFDGYAFRIDPHPKGRVAIILQDITQQRRDEEHYVLMLREIQHRARNMVTLLSGVAHLTQGSTVEEYRKRLLERFQSLSRAEAALWSQDGSTVDLAALMHAELSAYGCESGQVELRGPSVQLDERAARCYAMVLHELATNAVKHGSLSRAQGKVTVSWRVDGDKLFVFWNESGGPAVVEPIRRSAGRIVIERCIRNQLHGEVRFFWRSEGLRCEFEAPVGMIEQEL